MRDRTLSWPWTVVATVRVATDESTRPTALLTIHEYWTTLLRRSVAGAFFSVADAELLVAKAWRGLATTEFLLSNPSVTAPPILLACASSSSGWRKIGEILAAACDAVPAQVPTGYREKFRELK